MGISGTRDEVEAIRNSKSADIVKAPLGVLPVLDGSNLTGVTKSVYKGSTVPADVLGDTGDKYLQSANGPSGTIASMIPDFQDLLYVAAGYTLWGIPPTGSATDETYVVAMYIGWDEVAIKFSAGEVPDTTLYIEGLPLDINATYWDPGDGSYYHEEPSAQAAAICAALTLDGTNQDVSVITSSGNPYQEYTKNTTTWEKTTNVYTGVDTPAGHIGVLGDKYLRTPSLLPQENIAAWVTSYFAVIPNGVQFTAEYLGNLATRSSPDGLLLESIVWDTNKLLFGFPDKLSHAGETIYFNGIPLLLDVADELLYTTNVYYQYSYSSGSSEIGKIIKSIGNTLYDNSFPAKFIVTDYPIVVNEEYAKTPKGWKLRDASDVVVDTAAFVNNLTAEDDTVQKALETLDKAEVLNTTYKGQDAPLPTLGEVGDTYVMYSAGARDILTNVVLDNGDLLIGDTTDHNAGNPQGGVPLPDSKSTTNILEMIFQGTTMYLRFKDLTLHPTATITFNSTVTADTYTINTTTDVDWPDGSYLWYADPHVTAITNILNTDLDRVNMVITEAVGTEYYTEYIKRDTGWELVPVPESGGGATLAIDNELKYESVTDMQFTAGNLTRTVYGGTHTTYSSVYNYTGTDLTSVVYYSDYPTEATAVLTLTYAYDINGDLDTITRT